MTEDKPCLQIFHFNRKSGAKKCKTPFKVQPLTTKDALELDKNFCRKDPETGVQKQVKCLACDCRIEAITALQQHLKGIQKPIGNVECFGGKFKIVLF